MAAQERLARRQAFGFCAALCAGGVMWLATEAKADVTNYYHVSTNGSQASPYDTWQKAATNMQVAVNKAEADLGPGVCCIVLVTNGVYFTRGAPITVSKDITVRGVHGYTNTTVHGQYPVYSNRCLQVYGPGAVVEGLTITGGYLPNPQHGAGVYMTNGTLRSCHVCSNGVYNQTYTAGVYASGDAAVEDCLVEWNNGFWGPGGIYAGGRVRVTGCVVRNNRASSNPGGIYAAGKNVVVRDCLIAGNTGKIGGGLWVDRAAAYDCVVSNNVTFDSLGRGAGLQCDGGTVSGCTVTRNYARSNGKGAGLGIGGWWWAAPKNTSVVEKCFIVGNQSVGEAGGIIADRAGSIAIFRNCLIVGNRAEGMYGGGLLTDAGTTNRLDNCTIVDNNCGSNGGGIYRRGAGNRTVFTNCIVYSNTCSYNPGRNWAGAPVFVHSCTDPMPTAAGSTNNITDPPLLVAPGSSPGTNFVAGDYALRDISPCRDAGTNSAWMAGARDLAGFPRISPYGGIVDMGAYEFYVPPPAGTLILVR